jgi:hypothetical protein
MKALGVATPHPIAKLEPLADLVVERLTEISLPRIRRIWGSSGGCAAARATDRCQEDIFRILWSHGSAN